MAHLKKNTRGSVKGLSIHFERKTDNHSNEEIDVSRSYLNQDLMQDNSDMISRFDERLENVSQNCSGFIYAASLMGVTGARSALRPRRRTGRRRGALRAASVAPRGCG